MPISNLMKLYVNDYDLQNLRESGLTDATIRANCLRTQDGALLFSYRNLEGTVNGFARKRPHVPRMRDGKAIKYEQPKGSPLRAYFPVASLKKLQSESSAIYVTEGEKKALALSQLELAAIGIGGVWCGCKKRGEELIDDLAGITWKDRDVYIVFDYDEKPKTRRHVKAAARRLAKALRNAGVREVYNVELPPGPNDGKQGVDDFLVANDAHAFRTLTMQAEPVPSNDVPDLAKASGRTDTANGRRLTANFGEDVRWIGSWNKWLIWDGQRWKLDETLRIEAMAKEVAGDLFKVTGAAVAQSSLNTDTTKAMLSFAKASSSANGIRNMVALARSESGVSIGFDELDADPWLLNVENGTLSLKSGELQEHRREDFLTKLAPVTFDPGAECPLWTDFLLTIFDGNDDLIAYLQRLAGYNLTGVTEEHILPFLYGTGANGKSTFAETLLKLMGPNYSMKAPPDLLMARRGESHPTDRADLFGKRFVACIETEEGRLMAEALVKELTGGDRIRARRMREDFWEFTPTHHVWLASNHKPTITGKDHGIWRRIKLIPFDVVIPDDEQDKKLPTKLAAELPGILNWAIAGCREWQRNGMNEPEAVKAATTDYADEMDDIGKFIEECCELGDSFIAPATELYKEFKAFDDESSMSQTAFGLALKRRGFEKTRITKGPNKAKHGWRGLKSVRGAQIEALSEAFARSNK